VSEVEGGGDQGKIDPERVHPVEAKATSSSGSTGPAPAVLLHRILRAVLFLIWSERMGACPIGSEKEAEAWRQVAVERYKHDVKLHQKVNAAAWSIMEAAWSSRLVFDG